MEKFNLPECVTTKLVSDGIVTEQGAYGTFYFLTELINSLYGRCVFTDEEADYVTSNGEIIVSNNIFGEESKTENIIFTFNPENHLIDCKSVDTDQPLFRMVDGDSKIDAYDFYNGRKYFVNYSFTRELYKYTEFDENLNISYEASMSPLGSKIKDRETFEFTLIEPKKVVPQSLLLRAYDFATSNNVVKILTSHDLVPNVIYTDKIFDYIRSRKQVELSKSYRYTNKK